VIVIKQKIIIAIYKFIGKPELQIGLASVGKFLGGTSRYRVPMNEI